MDLQSSPSRHKKYEDFVLQKNCVRLYTFSDYPENTCSIFKYLKVLKL